MKRLHLFAGYNDRHEEVLDEVDVEDLDATRFRLVRTPGLILGIAAGDVIRVGRNSYQFEVVARGGNLAILVHAPRILQQRVQRDLGRQFRAMGGRLDDYLRKELAVFTVPLSPGFPAIEAILNGFADANPGVEWYYGNVYDPATDEPLGWWDSHEA